MDPCFADNHRSHSLPTPLSTLAMHEDLNLAISHKLKTEATSLTPAASNDDGINTDCEVSGTTSIAILEKTNTLKTRSSSSDTAKLLDDEEITIFDTGSRTSDIAKPLDDEEVTVFDTGSSISDTAKPLDDEEISTLDNGSNEQACFMGIPRELRDEIYLLLLVNPLLGKAESVQDIIVVDAFGPPEYGLSPLILAVNRQINYEASLCLYGENTFYMYCKNDAPFQWNPYHEACFSPVTRYLHRKAAIAKSYHHASIAKVRKWEVVVTLDTRSRRDPSSPLGLHQFCRSICHTPPQSVQMSFLIYFGLEYEDRVTPDPLMVRDLSSLRLLRGIKNFTMLPAVRNEPVKLVEMSYDDGYWYAQQSIPDELASEICQSAMSSGIVEFPTDIYDNLLAYARTFERFLPYKRSMGRWHLETIIGKELDKYRLPPEDTGFFSGLDIYNPFAVSGPEGGHPVECYLLQCRGWSQRDDLARVKKYRAYALEYLETQYQRIQAASNELRKFTLHSQSTVGVHNGCTYWKNKMKCRKGLKLLKSYYSTFTREMPDHIRQRIKDAGEEGFEALYERESTHCVELATSSLKERDFHAFRFSFDDAVRKLDREFVAIQKERMDLFRFDITERGCSIDVNMRLFDDTPSLHLEYPLCHFERFRKCLLHQGMRVVKDVTKKIWGK